MNLNLHKIYYQKKDKYLHLTLKVNRCMNKRKIDLGKFLEGGKIMLQKVKPISLEKVNLQGGLLGKKNKTIREKMIPYQWKAFNDQLTDAEPSHAIENFKIAAGKTDGQFQGMVFQDSDVAKWLEGVAYSLATNPDSELEKKADKLIDLIAEVQEEDGYLNTYFQVKKPDEKWTNLAECHELYCAGHMIEAGVAYYQATGKKKFLEIVSRLADHIDDKFGPQKDKLKGYPGHQEIELALVKLYRVTEQERYLKLAKFFLDQRGTEPNYFDQEWENRGKTNHWPDFHDFTEGKTYFQAHKPVREQKKAIGHAVRAVYMYRGMADVAAETGDESLLEACKKLWKNITTRQMYVTGGIGSQAHDEGFTFDYDLPGDTAYAETCAAIALVFFAQKMLHLEPRAEYADIMEKALYNGVLSGMSQDGERFFYVNPLAMDPQTAKNRQDHNHVKTKRQKWFGCACCPPNIVRLLSSIHRYLYSYNQEEIYVNLYTESEVNFDIQGKKVALQQTTEYPWQGTISFQLSLKEVVDFTLALRIPGWSQDFSVQVNGKKPEYNLKNGYLYLNRVWEDKDQVELQLDISPQRVYANPSVKENTGQVALQSGPIIYCLEEEDNGQNLLALKLPQNSDLHLEYNPDLLGGISLIKAQGVKMVNNDDRLYAAESFPVQKKNITAVPYYTWNNRGEGEMLVWINEQE